VARLRAAGAIVIGKTNTPEFGLGSQTYNAVFGATSNPYDRSRTCGGSSGGAAVALATGLLSVADGSDMMGSLRNPAGWNNVYGMRPSWGLVPADPLGDSFLHQLSTSGPMARNPRDLGAMLETMAGPDPRLPHARASASMADIAPVAAGVRIGWLGDWEGAFAYEPGVADLCRRALQTFGDLGAQVDEMAAPHSAEAIWQSWTTLRSWQVATGIEPLYATPASRERLKPEAIWEVERGLGFSAMEIHRASVLRSDWFRKAATLFEKVDVLALPSAQVFPFDKSLEWPREIAGRRMDTYHRWMEVMIAASLIGLPVVNVPVGFSEDGLPMGMQLIGPRGSDRRLLELAQAWHEATDWPGRHAPPGT
jgi:amidase